MKFDMVRKSCFDSKINSGVSEFWRRSGHDGDVDFLWFELKKIFALTNVVDYSLAMISAPIDNLWHCFICCTEEYATYCDSEHGYFINHRPLTSVFPVPASSIPAFVKAYNEHFGVLPSVWLEGLASDVQEFALGKRDYFMTDYKWSGWPGRT